MSKIYCGAKEVPKGKSRGSMKECAEKTNGVKPVETTVQNVEIVEVKEDELLKKKKKKEKIEDVVAEAETEVAEEKPKKKKAKVVEVEAEPEEEVVQEKPKKKKKKTVENGDGQ